MCDPAAYNMMWYASCAGQGLAWSRLILPLRGFVKVHHGVTLTTLVGPHARYITIMKRLEFHSSRDSLVQLYFSALSRTPL